MHAHGDFVFTGGFDRFFQLNGMAVDGDFALAGDRLGDIRGGDGSEGLAALTDGQFHFDIRFAQARGGVLGFDFFRGLALGALGDRHALLTRTPSHS
jgi:hypothetical protein